MAKSLEDKCELESVDNRLDVVLVNALHENFEIQEGFHTDRNEMLEFLRSVVKQHSDLDFVLHHRDTKLSGRIYKAFPKVTTKRVAIPSDRGKKTWRYTNLRRITAETEPDQNPTSKLDTGEVIPIACVPQKCQINGERCTEENGEDTCRSDTSVDHINDSLMSVSSQEDIDPKTNSKLVDKEPESDLGQFSDMLKWIKEHFVLDKNSSVQVKCVVEGIHAKFHTDITYKQSHKLVFSVFPGASSRAVNPVRLEVRGSFYSYRGIAPKSEQLKVSKEPANPRVKTSGKSKSSRSSKTAKSVCAKSVCAKSVCTKQTWIPPCGLAENGKTKGKQTRKRFLESCSVLKDNLDSLGSLRTYLPASSDVTAAAMERESKWRRMIDELQQERDQAIVERNQAMISLMELEREQQNESRTKVESDRRHTACHESVPSVDNKQSPVTNSDDNTSESRDWLRSLINRSNHILGEQMSEANSKYFPGSTLQNSCSPPRHVKYPRYSAEFIEMERFEKLKTERDHIWKNWMDTLKREKEDVIQQLKLEKMEVIQKMELEKSDAVECVQEKLTNQITILTREMRELKELLNHTMNERSLAIKHAQKLMEMVDEKTLKEAGLDSFPFDVTENHVVHLSRQKSADETENQNLPSCIGKGNKRKQSVPSKLKKNSKTCVSSLSTNCSVSVSTAAEKYLTDSRDQALFSDEQNFPAKSKVSSIDCLSSIVENIGRPSPERSPRKRSLKTDDESC